ncbi:MAG: exodeoxyribonuclease small subunit [Bacteroidota bacterium]
MKNELLYTAAFEELQQIVRDMEAGEITVDELSVKVKRAAELIAICKNKLSLSVKVKRAAELIAICKNKLSSTEEDVNLILKELEN